MVTIKTVLIMSLLSATFKLTTNHTTDNNLTNKRYSLNSVWVDKLYIQGGPIKTAHFLRYHIFSATTDIIMRFLLKCSEITAENNKRQFLKQVLNILCKVTGNGLRHKFITRLLDDDQPGLGWHCHRPVLKMTYPGHSCSRWTYWASPD